MGPDPSRAEAQIRWRRWVPIVALVGVFVLLRGLDSHLKGSDFNGFELTSAHWSVSSDNVGVAWDSLVGTETWAAVRSEVGDLSGEPLLEARKSLGIRLSPARWNAWFGHRAVFSGSNGDWGVTVKPGILFRVWDRVSGKSGAVEGSNLRSYQGFQYGWRDGFLCVSESSEYAAEMLGSEIEWISAHLQRDSIAIRVREPYEISFQVELRDGFPVQGNLGYSLQAAEQPLRLSSTLSSEYAMVLSGMSPEDWMPLFDELIPKWRNMGVFSEVLAETVQQLARQDNSGSSEYVWMLDDVIIKESEAVPLFTLAGVGSISANPPAEPVPYRTNFRWGELEGWKEPWFGHRYEWCVARDGETVVMTNRSENMRRRTGLWQLADEEDVDVRVQLHIPKLFSIVATILLDAAESGDISGWDRSDVEAALRSRLWRGVGKLGSVEIDGQVVEGGISFEGYLDRRGEVDHGSSPTAKYTEPPRAKVRTKRSASKMPTVSRETSPSNETVGAKEEVLESVRKRFHELIDGDSGTVSTNRDEQEEYDVTSIPDAAYCVYALSLLNERESAESLLDFLLGLVNRNTDSEFALGETPARVYVNGDRASRHYEVDLLASASLIWAIEAYSKPLSGGVSDGLVMKNWDSLVLLADFLEQYSYPVLGAGSGLAGKDSAYSQSILYDIGSIHLGLSAAIRLSEAAQGYSTPKTWSRARDRCEQLLRRNEMLIKTPLDVKFGALASFAEDNGGVTADTRRLYQFSSEFHRSKEESRSGPERTNTYISMLNSDSVRLRSVGELDYSAVHLAMQSVILLESYQ